MRIAAFEEANSYQILVIDDDLYDLNFLKNILSKQGYKVGSASSAQLALESVSSELPDLILLNPKMLEMDASEFHQLIKTNEKTSRIPVVFISALDEISDKERVVGVEGVEGEEYITKPFQAAVVLARVETQLRIQRLKAQLEEKDLQLQEEIDKRKRAEKEFKLNTQRWQAIEILKQMNQATINEIVDFALHEVISLTSSEIGYLCFASGDEAELNLFSRKDNNIARGNMPQDMISLLERDGGLWAEAIRHHRPMVNDFSVLLPDNTGLFDGTIGLIRSLSIPVFDNDRMVAFVSVANKEEEYEDLDILQVKLLIEATWRMMQRRKVEQEACISKEHFYKAFYTTQTIMAIIKNGEGYRFIDVNKSFLNAFGFSRNEVIGRNALELNIYVDLSQRDEIFRRINNSGKLSNYEVKVRTKQGDILTHIISFQVIQLNVGNCLLATGIDITERIRAYEELKQTRQENNETQQKIDKLKKIAAKSIGLDDVYCFSDSMRQIIKDTQKYHSDRSIPVMIHGETGTGKELIAKMIHYGDLDVVDTPFVALNCAAITNGLFESELFGYEAGAFTGGLKQGQKGKFDLAKGGTLFFDEIAEIPLDLQGKLLRVLEEKEFYRVGGLKKIKTDVRIICATNANLKTRVQNGTFREDLYYRLRVGYIYVPTLRERSEAILQFASVFLKQASELRQKSFKRISPEAGKILQSYSWPGNIRELKNVIDAIVLMHDYPELKPLHLDMITGQMKDLSLKSKEMSLQERRQIENTIIEDLSSIGKIKENISLPEIISQVESLSIKLTKDGINLDSIIEEVINRALYINNGNKTATANYLGISRTALYNRLNKQKTKPRE